MSTEIEVKILEVPLPEIEEKIVALGAVLVGEWLQTTIIYDYPDRRMIEKGAYVRLRQQGDIAYCTYKTPKQTDTSYKSMEEYEVVVGDLATMESILLGLGLQQVSYIEKKRKKYRHGEIIFDLDELPGIPPYLEIEAPGEREIAEMLAQLGMEATSYNIHELLLHYGMNIDDIKVLKF